MKDAKTREYLSCLMESDFYFDLSLKERYELLRHLIYSTALYTIRPKLPEHPN